MTSWVTTFSEVMAGPARLCDHEKQRQLRLTLSPRGAGM